MPKEQIVDHLTEQQVAARAQEMWPEVKAWAGRASQPWLPAPGSSLAEDDAQAQAMTTSHLARLSLNIGSEHMATALAYSLNFGPTLFSVQTPLRTAMVGGAQAVWLLSPKDRLTRVDRSNQLSRDAYWNQLQWANTISTQDPTVVDPEELAAARVTLTKLNNGKKGAEVKMTAVVRAAVEYAFASPPDLELWDECVAEFRYLSGTAHALPWVLHTRTDIEKANVAGQAAVIHSPSWAQLQGALSFAYAFLQTGWRLVDRQRSSA